MIDLPIRLSQKMIIFMNAKQYKNVLEHFLQKELSDMCAECEHYIGTIGGGMDQAISFMAKQGTVSCHSLMVAFSCLTSD